MRLIRVGTSLFLLAGTTAVTATAQERFNRGMIAVVSDAGEAYVGWRLLKDDPSNVAFNVYRLTAGADPARVNTEPITSSTNLVDGAAPLDRENRWFVRPVVGGRELAPSDTASLPANSPPNQVR